MPSFTQKTWVDVPDESSPPGGAVATEAAEFNRLEQGIADSIAHANALFDVHGGKTYYTGPSSLPPTSPPTDLLWLQSDTGDAVRNTGTAGTPVWSPVFSDDSKLTTADFVSDYIASGLLPPVPSNSLTLAVPSGVAYINGKRVTKGADSHSVPARKSTLVDISDEGVFSNVDNGVLVEDCEDVWLEKTDADFTQSVIAGVDSNAVRFTIAAGASAGDFVTEAVPTVDLSPYTILEVKIRSSIALAAGDVQILLDNTAQCASPVHTLNVPALTANTWTTAEIAYTPTTGTDAIISVGAKMAVDKGAFTLDIEDIWALEVTEPAVTTDSLRLFEARADANISQIETVDITTAVNSTVYTVQINGVDITYTSDASATEGEIALGLVAAINASVDPLVTPVTGATAATSGSASATLTVTADTPGVPFTIAVGTNLTVSNTVPNSTASVVTVTDMRDLTPSLITEGTDYLTHDEADALYSPIGVSGYRTLVQLSSDVAHSATSFATVTGLSFPVTSGTMYRFEAIIAFTSAATTTGSKWSLDGPAMTRGSWSVRTPPASGAYPNTPIAQYQAAYDTGTITSGTPTTDNNLVLISGFILPSASGTVSVRFASEIAASAITAKAGSCIEYW